MEGLWFVANATQNGERQSIQQIADPAAAAAGVQGLERNISAQTWPGLNYFFPRTESAARAHRIGDAAAQQTQGVVGVHCAAVRGARDRDCGTEVDLLCRGVRGAAVKHLPLVILARAVPPWPYYLPLRS